MPLAPALLLSMPQLLDPNFARTVVLLCEHSDEGAFGLVVNRPAETTAAEAVQMEPGIEHPNDLPLLLGGPVEPQRGWILRAGEGDGIDSRPIGAGLSLSASPLVLREVLGTHPRPHRTAVPGGVRRVGPRSTRHRTGRVGLADHAGGAGPDLRDSAGRGVGDGHSTPRRRSQPAADGTRRALTGRRQQDRRFLRSFFPIAAPPRDTRRRPPTGRPCPRCAAPASSSAARSSPCARVQSGSRRRAALPAPRLPPRVPPRP